MKIIIAEDDPVSLIALRGLLENLGYDVVATTNGVEALQRWNESKVPILVLDWMMPEMDGIEVCRSVRSSKPESYTCIIMLTAKREREDRVVALKAGADVFLTKPLNRDELVARLQVANRILEMERTAAVLN